MKTVAQPITQGKKAGLCAPKDDLRKMLSFFLHMSKTLRSFINNESECPSVYHAARFKMAPDHDSSVIFYGFGQMNRRDMHEKLPCRHGCAAGKDEIERFLIELRSRMRLRIQCESSHAIDDVLEVRGDAEVPNGTCEDNAVRALDKILNTTEVIARSAGCIVEIEGKMPDIKIAQTDLCRCPFDGPNTFHKAFRESFGITRLIHARDNDCDLHDCATVARAPKNTDMSW